MGFGTFTAVLLSILMVMQVHQTTSLGNWFVLTPQDTKLLVGDSTVIYCQLNTHRVVEDSHLKVTWSKNNEEIRFSEPEFSHYSLLGDPHSVQYYLLIANADEYDTAVFSCAVFENIETDSGMTQWEMQAVATASVEVLLRPSAPECRKHDLTNGLNHTEVNYEGDLIELSCVGYLSDPSFALTMMWKNQIITEENGGQIHIDDDNIQELVYRFNASYEDNGAHFQCILTSSEFPEYRESCDNIALNIIHEPKVDFALDKTEVYQNESLTVSCFAVSNPAFTTYHWITHPLQVVVFRNSGRVLEIPNVTSDTGVLNVTCEVWNDHGFVRESRSVPVLSRNEATTQPDVITDSPIQVTPTEMRSEPVTESPMQGTPTEGRTEPVTQVSSTKEGFKPITKPVMTTASKQPDKTTKSKGKHLTYLHGQISTALLIVIIIVPIIIITLIILIFVFLYKTVKLSTKRSDDQIRVLYQDGATVINTQRTRGRRNLNVLVQPAMNERAMVPTEGMEAGAYSLPPPYSTGLPSVMDVAYEDMARGGEKH